MENKAILWQDKKRYFGSPISFTEYQLTKDKLYIKSGILRIVKKEALLYKVIDITFVQTIIGQLFNTGTIELKLRTDTDQVVKIENVLDPEYVRELIGKTVQESYKNNNIMRMEM